MPIAHEGNMTFCTIGSADIHHPDEKEKRRRRGFALHAVGRIETRLRERFVFQRHRLTIGTFVLKQSDTGSPADQIRRSDGPNAVKDRP